MLERIVYISFARETQTQASVTRILKVSRARNQAHGVTGLLIGGGSWWLQLLEGQPRQLEPVWQSIRSDPRHDPVVLVQRRGVAARSFAEWSLQFRQAGDAGFAEEVNALCGGIADQRVRNQIIRFSQTFLTGVRLPWEDAA